MAEGQNPGNYTELSPDILMFNILPRLPAKCVGRFMCVSKEWHSFLTTPHFAKMQLLHQKYYYDKKLLLLSTKTPFTFRTIDCETPTTKDDLSGSSRPLPFEEVGLSFTLQMSIVASLHGLVCIHRHRCNENGDEYTDLVLWNPLTSDYKRLPKPSCDRDCFFMDYIGRFGLYYTICDNDYKLVCVICNTNPKVYIYSLKSDSWRKVVEPTKRTTSDCVYSVSLMPSVVLDEKLYFLKQKQIYGENAPSYVIMMFDTKTEELRDIVTPTPIRDGRTCNGFMVVNGSIHLFVSIKDPRDLQDWIELWRMEIGSDGDWTKVVTYSWRREKPLHIMRDGDWLVYSKGLVYKRDMKKHTYDIVCRFESMDMNLGWKYMESLVSPNQYIN